MLTTNTLDLMMRTGRDGGPRLDATGSATSVRRTRSGLRAAGTDGADTGFRQVLGQASDTDQRVSGTALSAGTRASAATQSQAHAIRNSNIALIIPYRRGESAQVSAARSATGSVTGSNDAAGSRLDALADPDRPGPKAPTPFMSASQVEWGARLLPDLRSGEYVVPNEVIGSIAPRLAGAGPDKTAFATNLYRVPEWGLQEFVTSDGSRHRFDVEVVFPEAKVSSWLGGPVSQIHPEVASFVVQQLRDTLAKAGIPQSAIADIQVSRSFGGPGDRQFYMDNVRFTRADGETFGGSMNIYMRDPKHVVPMLQEFFLGEIPS
ncbi:MAG: hypothetical protein MUF01_00010 [Bryobacterales bacterium]|nr:hypothetical protein [Bryobacterales bacterium]